jgi:small GTP-binding protein
MSAEPTEDGGYHFSFKVAICGDTGVGKTTLLEGEGASSYARTSGDTTVGINFRVKFYEVDGQTYRVQFWDCPGAERYMKLTSRYCAGAAGAIFVFDVNNRATFDHISDWIRQVEKNGPVLKVLVGNKVDDNSRGSGREVTQQEAEAFADKNGLDYFETAALTGLRVNHVFQGKFFSRSNFGLVVVLLFTFFSFVFVVVFRFIVPFHCFISFQASLHKSSNQCHRHQNHPCC